VAHCHFDRELALMSLVIAIMNRAVSFWRFRRRRNPSAGPADRVHVRGPRPCPAAGGAAAAAAAAACCSSGGQKRGGLLDVAVGALDAERARELLHLRDDVGGRCVFGKDLQIAGRGRSGGRRAAARLRRREIRHGERDLRELERFSERRSRLAVALRVRSRRSAAVC